MPEHICKRKIDTNECLNIYLWPIYSNIRLYLSHSDVLCAQRNPQFKPAQEFSVEIWEERNLLNMIKLLWNGFLTWSCMKSLKFRFVFVIFLWFCAHLERYLAVWQTGQQRSERAQNHKKAKKSQKNHFCLSFTPLKIVEKLVKKIDEKNLWKKSIKKSVKKLVKKLWKIGKNLWKNCEKN